MSEGISKTAFWGALLVGTGVFLSQTLARYPQMPGIALAAEERGMMKAKKRSWYETTRHGSAFRNVRDFGAKGNGISDDTRAIQTAIDHQRGSKYEKAPAIVYLPSGTYKVTDTLILWKYTHLIGNPYSPPTIVLTGNAPGFDDPNEKKPVIVTTNGWNVDPATRNWAACTEKLGGTANNTFYTQIHHIRLRIEPGNRGATGILWRVAQATSMRDVTIDAGDAAIGLDLGGDVDYRAFDEPPSQGGGGTIEDVRIRGGHVGLRARGSQWLFRSVHISGQRDAGVHITGCWNFDFIDLRVEDAEVGMRIEKAMVVIVLDSKFHRIRSGTAIATDGSWCYLENVRCDGVKWVVDKSLPGNPGGRVQVASWFQGRGILGNRAVSGGALPKWRRTPLPLRKRPLVDDASIGNVYDFGAVGDGKADDTQALQRAINQCRTVFLPFGRYKVSDTLRLRRDTRLFGEGLSEIYLADHAPGFGDPDHPKPIIQTPDEPGGTVVLADLRITAGEGNAGAIGVDWRVGEQSGVWDVHIKPEPKSGVKYHLLLRGSGGGYFSNLWCPGTKNSAGFLGASRTPAWFYGTAFEHHSEVAYHLDGAENYTFVCAQTEQSPHALLIENSRNIAIYGTVFTFWRQIQPHLVKVTNSEDLAIYGLNSHNSERLLIFAPPEGEGLSVPGGADWRRLTVVRLGHK